MEAFLEGGEGDVEGGAVDEGHGGGEDDGGHYPFAGGAIERDTGGTAACDCWHVLKLTNGGQCGCG